MKKSPQHGDGDAARRGCLGIAVGISVVLATSACQAPLRRGSSIGVDYFRRDFRCSERPPVHEQHPRFQLFYGELRRRFAQDSSLRKQSEIVITGDSIAMLFTEDLLRKELSGLDITNRGIGGDTSRMLLGRVEDMLVLSPRVVIVSIGGNDLLGGRCIAEILENTEKLVGRLRAASPKIRVMLTSVPPVLGWRANSISPFYNYQLRRLAAQLRVSYLDLWGELARADFPELKAKYHRFLPGKKRPDVVHFNEAGYGVWAHLIRRALAERP